MSALLNADSMPLSPSSPASTSYRRKSLSDITQSTLIIPTTVLNSILTQLKPALRPRYTPAIQQLCLTLATAILSAVLLHTLPWWLLPVAWLVAGTFLSLTFMIARDCANDVYTPSTALNRIIGFIAFVPFLQSFATFKWQQAIQLGKGFGSSTSPGDDGDDGTYDDSAPMWVQAKERFFPPSIKQHSDTPRLTVVVTATTVYALLVALLAVTYWYGGIIAIAKYYILPLIAYQLLYAPSYSAVTQSASNLIPRDMTITVPTYHLWKLSAAIQAHFSGESAPPTVTADTADTSLSWFDWARGIIPRIHWIHLAILTLTPLVGIYLAQSTPLRLPTLMFALFYYAISGLGITAGYHRLFAHRAYEAHPIVTFVMMMMGTAALQGSLKWWCGGHRTHHRYTDTIYDPYNAKNGFWYAHIGWMLIQPLPENRINADIADLKASPMIRWQHKQYYWLGPFMAYAVPTLIPGLLWGDWMGGYVYAGLLRLFAVHHATFCVNSVAHWFGDHTFDDNRTPRDHIVTALITFGEGYHNFHHEFPNDYRNGIRLLDYDPTKWLIKALNLVGLTWKLRMFPANEISKGKIHMIEKKVAIAKQSVVYPPDAQNLPPMTLADLNAAGEAYRRGDKSARALVVVDCIVHDITRFIPRHPGGEAFIRSAVGTNATVRFNGQTGVYKHSQAAAHLLSTYRIAQLVLSDQERAVLKAKEQRDIARTLPPPTVETVQTANKTE